MLTLSQVSKSYGGRTLFSGVNLQINRGDCIGLVGPNGAGKSTLFSIILGENSPDDGSVFMEKRITVGFLPQESAPAGDETILDLATAVSAEVAELRVRLRAFEEGSEQDLEHYHEWHERFADLGGFDLEPRAKKILSGLAFRESDFDRPARTLSGGWIMRAHLARLLVMEPDLLMLDEPTNHLDLESLGWFQNYLSNYPGAILMISHDREFLNQLTDSIIEIRHGTLHRYRGNYDSFLLQREARAEQHLAAYENQQKEIQRLQAFADRFGAKASKASQAQSKLKQIDRMEKIEAPMEESRKIRFRFPQPRKSGLKVVTLEAIHHAYGDLVVYRGIDFKAERGQRVVLVGPNGAGKSTLLKILAGVLPVQQGTRELGLNVKVGYYSQQRVEMLDTQRTVLEEAMDGPHEVSEQNARTLLGSFLFREEDVFKKVNVLSGGEKSRLALVKLLLDPPNLLLMDEPTTHLDMASIDALLSALEPFEGTLIFISHDVHFIRSLAQNVLHISAGKLTLYHGDYDYYLQKSQAGSARAALTAGAALERVPDRKEQQEKVSAESGSFKSREQKRAEAQQRQEEAQSRKKWEKQVAALEAQIIELEHRQAELTAKLEDASTYADAGGAVAINRDLSRVADRLQALTRQWDELAAQEAVQR
jgi:ATP-binding cassette, subfamily F, member 3